MPSALRIPSEVAAAISFYVYALRDPRDGKVFYVGKGVDDRINSHLHEAGKDLESERAKLRKINDIEAEGRNVDLLFIRTGLPDEASAFIVEQAVIDAFYADGHELTNLVRGHHSGTHGLATLGTEIGRLGAKPCPPIEGFVTMYKIQRNWRPDSRDEKVYEFTRGHWNVAAWVRARAEIALGVAHGVVRGVYLIDDWFPSEQPWDLGKGKWGFNGRPAPELQHVVGTHVRELFNGRVRYRRFENGYPGAKDPGAGSQPHT